MIAPNRIETLPNRSTAFSAEATLHCTYQHVLCATATGHCQNARVSPQHRRNFQLGCTRSAPHVQARSPMLYLGSATKVRRPWYPPWRGIGHAWRQWLTGSSRWTLTTKRLCSRQGRPQCEELQVCQLHPCCRTLSGAARRRQATPDLSCLRPPGLHQRALVELALLAADVVRRAAAGAARLKRKKPAPEFSTQPCWNRSASMQPRVWRASVGSWPCPGEIRLAPPPWGSFSRLSRLAASSRQIGKGYLSSGRSGPNRPPQSPSVRSIAASRAGAVVPTTWLPVRHGDETKLENDSDTSLENDSGSFRGMVSRTYNGDQSSGLFLDVRGLFPRTDSRDYVYGFFIGSRPLVILPH